MTSTGTPDTQGPITTATSTDKAVRPFTIAVDQADLDDLADRLARTRLPRPAPGDDWTYGTPNQYLAAMVEQWRTFDWRGERERADGGARQPTEDHGPTRHLP